MKLRSSAFLLFVGLLLPLPAVAAEFCFSQSEGHFHSQAVRETRIAIDLACPCEDFTSKGLYRRCAKVVVAQRIEEGSLPPECKKAGRDHAWRSRCGIEGAVVCCRADGAGNTRHRIVKSAEDCVGTISFPACRSFAQSISRGCDSDGCSDDTCGNDELEPAENCEPNLHDHCGLDCDYEGYCGDGAVDDAEVCDPPSPSCDAQCANVCSSTIPATCGNGVLDAGEACEPPGAGSCAPDCTPAACSAAGTGEIDVACIPGNPKVGAAGSASGYLLAWTGSYRRGSEILARRFDATGLPTDAVVTVATDGEECGSLNSDPTVASDGTDYYVAWTSYSEITDGGGRWWERIDGRRFAAASGVLAQDRLLNHFPFGSCFYSLRGLSSSSGAGSSRFAIGYQGRISCAGNYAEGLHLDFRTDPVFTDENLGFGFMTPTGAPSVSSISDTLLWAYHSVGVHGQWTDAGSTASPFTISTKQTYAGGPAVSAGAGSFLVAWSDGATSTLTDVRAVRVTRAAGRIDADGGLLLATVPAGLSSVASAAFDGTRWLVAWTEPSGMTHDLRAVAVNADGSVVDATPRLIASDVRAERPVLASTSGGKVLVVYERIDGASTAVRAQLVTP